MKKKLIAAALAIAMLTAVFLPMTLSAHEHPYTIEHALDILKHLAGLEMLPGEDEWEVNYDLAEPKNVIDINDALEILKILAEITLWNEDQEHDQYQNEYTGTSQEITATTAVVTEVSASTAATTTASLPDFTTTLAFTQGETAQPGTLAARPALNSPQGNVFAPPGAGAAGENNPIIFHECNLCEQINAVCHSCGYCDLCEFEIFGIVHCSGCNWGGDCLSAAGINWCYTCFICELCCENYSEHSALECPIIADYDRQCVLCDRFGVACDLCDVCAECNRFGFGILTCLDCFRSMDCIARIGARRCG
jgi:hypothetical protein